MKPQRVLPADVERFWSKVAITDGCWIWTGTVASNGYGHLSFRRADPVRLAHRLSYEINVGEIPNSLNVCHKCDNRRCVRPDHLFLGTQSDNIRDCSAKGRLRNFVPPRKSHCVKGHPFDSANTHVTKTGKRQCRRCCALRMAARRAA